MNEDFERGLVVKEALSWIGTPYHSNADRKKIGVDCGMIILRVFADTGLIEPFDPRPYPTQWALNQSAEFYLGIVLRFAREIDGPAKPGDLVMFKVGKVLSHAAIVLDWPNMIHAAPPCCQIDNALNNSSWARRVPRFFSIWPREPRVIGFEQ